MIKKFLNWFFNDDSPTLLDYYPLIRKEANRLGVDMLSRYDATKAIAADVGYPKEIRGRDSVISTYDDLEQWIQGHER